MRGRYVAGVGAVGVAAATYILFARPWHLRWGANAHECGMSLPGDDLIVSPDLTATRAITVRASADQVWPWIVQLGQGRGGFYSYDFLENLAGCDIHSADHIVPGWQDVGVGDEVRLAPQRWGSALPLWNRADHLFYEAGFRWEILRPHTTSRGPGCSTMNRTRHRGYSCVSDAHTHDRGLGSSSNPSRRSAS